MFKQWQWVSHFILWCYHKAFHKKDHNNSASTFTQNTMWIRSALFWDILQCIVVIPYWSFGTTEWSHLPESRNPRRKPQYHQRGRWGTGDRDKHFPLMLLAVSNCFLHPGTELFKADYICIHQVKWEWSMNMLPSWDGVPTLLSLLQDKNMTTSCVRLGEKLLSHSEWIYSQYNVEISVSNFCMLLEQDPINLCCNPVDFKFAPKVWTKGSENGHSNRDPPATTQSDGGKERGSRLQD
jgi:hypothetical protein